MFMASPRGPNERVFLYGTSASPLVSTDSRINDAAGLTSVAGWIFQTDGSVDKFTNGSQAEDDTGSPRDHWYLNNPTTVGETYYIRFTLEAGFAANTVSSDWSAMTSQTTCYHSEVVAPWTAFTRNGTYKVEIATDSGGTNIISTGYYRYVCAIDSGL